MGAILLSLIGLVAAVAIWQSGHPVLGVAVGILLVGGLGWKLLGAALMAVVQPHVFTQGREFIAAWEARQGPMLRGIPATHPPRGLYQMWRKEHRRTGVSAGAWLDEMTGVPEARRERARITELKHYDLVVGPAVPMTFWEESDGRRMWRYWEPVSEAEAFQLNIAAQVELTKEQVRRGEPPWFPQYLDLALSEGALGASPEGDAPGQSDPAASPSDRTP